MKFYNCLFLCLFVNAAMFTSCSEDIGPDQQITQKESTADPGFILLPSTIIEQGDKIIDDYVASLSAEEYTIHLNAHIIMTFLDKNELLDQFSENILSANFQNVDFSEHLNQKQIAELESSLMPENVDFAELEMRAQCCYSYYAPYCVRYTDRYGRRQLTCCCEQLVTVCNYCQGSSGPY